MPTAGRSSGVAPEHPRGTELDVSRIRILGSVAVRTRMAHLLRAAPAARKEGEGLWLFGISSIEPGNGPYASQRKIRFGGSKSNRNLITVPTSPFITWKGLAYSIRLILPLQ